ncbi:hypothetical protein [Glycomyces terrestris]|uniref:DUF3558 domain-containing protein n=1 Tax=Glycomyces terrestris TaxID=2493553 RepID=A0A426UW66_9ACTN|nr:hypothetical protein [Glycomyces terrestris]RRR98458.1 hypothetical protein EIW28_16375 [Glycomyces terrestris]
MAIAALAVLHLRGGFSDSERPNGTESPSEAATGVAADFAKTACDDFDLAGFEALAASAAELDTATAQADPDTETGVLHCVYRSGSGMDLSLTVVSETAADYAERTTDQSRRTWEGDPDTYTIEDFDSGGLSGYTNAHLWDSRQVFLLSAGAGRLLMSVGLTAEPGEFETADALAVTGTMAAQAHERFAAYD